MIMEALKMNIVSLARFQFAMTTIFHFFFVPFSIGTGKSEYKKMTKFWGNIFLLSFAVGVVTGIFCFFIGYSYSSGPRPISSLPLGELASGFTMGFMIALLSVYLNSYQTFTWSWASRG